MYISWSSALESLFWLLLLLFSLTIAFASVSCNRRLHNVCPAHLGRFSVQRINHGWSCAASDRSDTARQQKTPPPSHIGDHHCDGVYVWCYRFALIAVETNPQTSTACTFRISVWFSMPLAKAIGRTLSGFFFCCCYLKPFAYLTIHGGMQFILLLCWTWGLIIRAGTTTFLSDYYRNLWCLPGNGRHSSFCVTCSFHHCVTFILVPCTFHTIDNFDFRFSCFLMIWYVHVDDDRLR